MEFNVEAVDSGSPPLTGHTLVHITISDFQQPSAFCFATDRHSVTICWQNSMRGRHIRGFKVEVDGSIHEVANVAGDIDAQELCYTVKGTQLGHIYYFRVSVTSSVTSSQPDEIVQLMLNTTGIGFTPECLHYGFDACNYLKPCSNGGQCQKQGTAAFSINYQCDCLSGWKGKNCTSRDVCHDNPCRNNGSCTYISHQQYNCSCVDNFIGSDCQMYNVCSQFPCKHGGQCSMVADGKYSCACSDQYSGQNCEVLDPCKTGPCMNGGACSRVSDTEFHCQCSRGFYGKVCNEMNPCLLENICDKNGTCVHTGNNTFICECPPGSTGERCSKFDPCSIKGLCSNNATCYLKDTGTLYGCRCLPGYYGGECQHYDRCYGVDCGNGTCESNAGDISCKCQRGYYGTKCEFVNACLALDPCGNRGRCENTTGSGYVCHCLGELYGPNCTKINSCKIVKCQNGGTCVSSEPNMYRCRCPDGYYDEQCGSYNPCVTSPCKHGGVCTNTSSSVYSCTCSGAYFGTNCERRDPCFQTPCLNGATCTNVTDDDFECRCTPEFAGRTCHVPNPCLSSPCKNSAVCSTVNTLGSSDHVGVNCSCSERFTGEFCETRVHPCVLARCSPGRKCIATGDESYECVCANHSPRPDCKPVCPAKNESLEEYGLYEWPETLAGGKANITCYHESLSPATEVHAVKYCIGNNNWTVTDIRECPKEGLLEAFRKLNELKNLTSDPSNLKADQVSNFTTILEEVFKFSLEEKQIAQSIVQVVSNLVDVNVSVTVDSNTENRTSERMFYLLDNYAASVPSDVSISTENINISAVDVSYHSVHDVIEFAPTLVDGNQTVDAGISIELPREVLEKAADVSGSPTRLQFIGFRKASFFIPSNADPNDIPEQRVISASVRRGRIVGLKHSVTYRVKHSRLGRNASCVFWNVSTKSWSPDGIVTLTTDDNTTECQTNHLTSFAVVMDPNPQSEKLPGIHEDILSTISYIGIGISLISLAITILTYGLFRTLRNEKSGKILLNLCTAMLLMDVSFLLGTPSYYSGAGLCTTVAVLLHYFLLATFMWMLLEALEMYRALVTVFAKYARWYMMKRAIAAWGVPLIIVGITLGIDLEHYKPKRDFCFLSQGSQIAYYTSLMAPCCFVIITNTIVFILVSRVIIKPRFQQTTRGEGSVTPAQFRGAFTVMILLGVTWVFGPLAIEGVTKLVFNYLFCFLNTFQGFLIFIFRCVFNPEARLCWVQLVKTGTLKRKRGPIKSVYSEYSSKGDNSKSRPNGSYVHAGTLKTNMGHSNGWHPQLNGIPHENGKPRKQSEMFTLDLNSRESDNFSTKADIYQLKDEDRDSEECYTHL
ncbi:cadherin EGF LAG seven-pass G-type receptor 2-like [Gigantopelta aegis]|uniref:cadherin EGF LAG seven-pass G-type receptor 2-like n=1 Tax=Gigantopelta aegis TaxID=1735272 RepID=UPI001B8891D2|nr:cadherin EGF LAG seven-pass G-type receptor 2-like [Gigantopelta aegis]